MALPGTPFPHALAVSGLKQEQGQEEFTIVVDGRSLILVRGFCPGVGQGAAGTGGDGLSYTVIGHRSRFAAGEFIQNTILGTHHRVHEDHGGEKMGEEG